MYTQSFGQLPQKLPQNNITSREQKPVNNFFNNTSKGSIKAYSSWYEFKQFCIPLFKPFTTSNKKNRIIKKILKDYVNSYTTNPKKAASILKVLNQWSHYVVENLGPAFIRCRKIRAISKELFDMLLSIDHVLAAGQKASQPIAALLQSAGYRTFLELTTGGILIERLRTLLETSPGRTETIRKIIRFLGRVCSSSEIRNFVQKSLSMIDQLGPKLANNTPNLFYTSTPRSYAHKHPYISPEMLQKAKAKLGPQTQFSKLYNKQ